MTYSCKQKIKIYIPATITFATKVKVKMLAVLLLTWKEVFAGKLFVAILNPINKTDSIYVNFAKSARAVGTHILMDSLKLFCDYLFLNFSGTISHIVGPRYETLFVLWKALCTWGVIKWQLRKLYWLFVLSIKASPVISGHSLCFTLNISITNAWIFLWCIETKLSFSKRFLKDDFLSR